jgi:hypothetical protein
VRRHPLEDAVIGITAWLVWVLIIFAAHYSLPHSLAL